MRMTPDGRKTLKRFTLVEVIVAIAVGSIIVGASLSFFYKGAKVCASYSEKAQAGIESSLLKKAFRNFVHARPEVFMARQDKAVFADGAEISAGAGKVEFRAGGRAKSYALPGSVRASLALEEEPGLQPCLALRLDHMRGASDSERESFRIAALLTKKGEVHAGKEE